MNWSLPHILPLISDPELRYKKYLNFLLALLARREQAAEVVSRPFELTLDPSTHCQLSCPYCSVGNKTIQRTPGLFSPELNKQVLNELGETAFIIWYFSTGEPLLNRQIGELLSLAQQYELFTILSTNLSLPLPDERIDDLLRSGLGAICVSLDGVSPQSYARYRVGGDFDLVVDNMTRLIRRKQELGLAFPLIEWRFLVFRHNQAEMNQAAAMAAKFGVDLLEFFPGYGPPDAQDPEVQMCTPDTPIGGPSGPALDQARKRRDTFLRRRLKGAKEGDPEIPASMLRHKCDWLYFGTTVFSGGSVGPCCVSNDEPDDFGHLERTEMFSEIWNNARYRAARQLFAGQPSPDLVCNRCPNPDAQDYQFRLTLRALLRNAPNWVLLALSRAPDRFFWEVDKKLSPKEMSVLEKRLFALKPEPHDLERLRWARPSDEWTMQHLDLLRTLLKIK
jgi:pyruvate-formate lyase-activating enzyme